MAAGLGLAEKVKPNDCCAGEAGSTVGCPKDGLVVGLDVPNGDETGGLSAACPNGGDDVADEGCG